MQSLCYEKYNFKLALIYNIFNITKIFKTPNSSPVLGDLSLCIIGKLKMARSKQVSRDVLAQELSRLLGKGFNLDEEDLNKVSASFPFLVDYKARLPI